VLVGKVGALRFFEKTFGPAHPFTDEAKNALSDERLFSRFLNEMMSQMEEVYALKEDFQEKMRLRKEVFALYQNRFDALKKDFKTRQFVHFGQMPPNNAYLMTVALYHRYFDLFEAVLKKENNSIKKMISFLEVFSGKGGDLMVRLRNTVNDGKR
jgi:predicted aminopeptidase